MKKAKSFKKWFILVLVASIYTEVVKGSTERNTFSLALLQEPEDLLFLNTMPTKLKCTADGNPRPKVTWLNEKYSIIQNTTNLITVFDNEILFKAFLPDQYNSSIHDAKYRCRVTSDVGAVVSRLIYVKAVIDKRYSPIVYHQSAPIGGSAIFKCVLPSGQEDYINIFAWQVTYPGGGKTRTLLSGMSIDSFHALTTGQLVVSDVNGLHEEYLFSCVTVNILNNATLTSSAARLFPNAPEPFIPEIFVYPKKDIVIFVGETLILNCDASSYPLPSFTWYKDGSRLKMNARMKTITGGSMSVLRSTLNDQGNYTCLIEYKDVNEHEEKITLETNVIIKDPLFFTETPKPVFSNTGKSVTFNCKAKGTTPFQVEWRKDGRLLTSNSQTEISPATNSLTVNDITINDEGIFQCVVKNSYDQIQAVARLVVDAMLPSIQSITPKQIIKSDITVSLTCACVVQPSPKVTWYQDNVQIQIGDDVSIVETLGVNNAFTSVLTIRNAQTKYSGVYKCIAQNRAGEDVATTSIEIEGIPAIVNFPSRLVGVSGRIMTIDCCAKGFPKVTHIWYKNGIPMQVSDRITIHSNGTLVLKRFGSGDIGTYWCTVDNSYGKTQANVAIDILDPPQLTRFTLIPALVGRRAHGVCTNNGGDGVIKWYKNGFEVQPKEWIKIMDVFSYGKLISFEPVRITDRGRYTCVATNNAGLDEYSADLIVYEKPSFENEPPAKIVVKNSYPITLVCSATGFPEPQITWFKKSDTGYLDTVKLNHRVKQLANGTLVIGIVQASDTGKYVCQASFFDKSYVPDPISREIYLQVRVPAKIIHTSPLVARNLKSRAIDLFCSIIGTPVLSLQWFKDGLKIADGSYKYAIYHSLSHDTQPPTLNSSIQIRNLAQVDNGKYTCMGSNMYDSETVEFQVFVEETPHKPTTIEEIKSSSHSIHLSWKPGYDGNAAVIHYRLEIRGAKSSWDLGKFFVVNGNQSEFTVVDLKPGQEYAFRVYARNKYGISDWSEEAILKTKEDAPSGPPRNVSASAIAKDKIYVQWKAPEPDKCNGLIIEYRIYYAPQTNSRSSMLNITTRYNAQFTLRDLLQFTSYEIRVQAATSAGGGPLSSPLVEMTLEGVPTRPPQNIEARSISSDTILIDWKQVPPQFVNGLLMGYKIIYTDIEKQKTYQKTIVNSMSYQLSNLRKFARYRVAVLAFTRAGDGVWSDHVIVRTKEDIPDRPSQFKATAASPAEILVAWSSPENPNGKILHYTLYYQSIGSENINRVDNIQAEEASFMVKALTLGVNYSFWMTASTGKGEGPSTKKLTAWTSIDVPAKIITPSGLVLRRKIGSDVKLPCAAVGYPRPSIIWFRHMQTDVQKQKRWMAADVPKELFKITKEDAGEYNCTAVNEFGRDWNHVILVVQFPPEPPDIMDSNIVGEYAINITWQPAKTSESLGYSSLIQHYINYMIDDGNVDKDNLQWRQIIVSAEQTWFVVYNVTRLVVYFRIASESEAGIGIYSQPVKFEISGRAVSKFPLTKSQARNEENPKEFAFLKPVLIAIVVLTTIIIILLFIASWDRREKRIRKPRCERLVLCKCSCKRKRAFNHDPYGEPHLPWPWNIKSNRHSGAFDINDELLQSDDQLEFKYASNCEETRNPDTESLKKKFITSNKFDFEPVVLFKPNSPERHQTGDNITSSDDSRSKRFVYNNDVNNSKWQNLTKDDNRRPTHSAYDKPSIIEKYLRSQEELLDNENYVNEFVEQNNPQDSALSEDPINRLAPPLMGIERKNSRGSADGKSMDYSKPPEYDEVQRHNSFDAPRALFRGNSPSKRGNRSKRKSLDSLILRTLENIEEKQSRSNNPAADKEALEQHAAHVIKELLTHPPQTYDSVSSTCSSSVGELRRAFEFGKKFGLQDYNIPSYMPDYDLDDDDEELDYQAHERLLNALDITNFTEIPRDMNDVKVKIPLPIRLASEALDDDDIISSDDDEGIGGGYDRGEQSLV